MGKFISGLMEKSFASQSGVFSVYGDYFSYRTGDNFNFYLNIKNDYDNFHFGFRESNRRIIDRQNKYLYGLNKNERINFKILSSGDFVNFYINNNLTSTNYISEDLLDYSSKVSIEIENGTADVNLYISGEKPNYEFSGFSFSGANPTGIGYIINKNSYLPFRLYSGVSESGRFFVSGDDFNVTGIKELKIMRNYTLSLDNELEDNVNPYNNFNFYSNFGIFSEPVSIQTVFPITQVLDYQIIPNFSGIGSGSSFISWANYKGVEIYQNGVLNEFQFKYITGNTGNVSLSDIFRVRYNGQGTEGENYNIDYNSGISGFKLNLNTIGNSGINYFIERFNYTGNAITMKVIYSGYNTGFDYIFSGI